MEVIVYSANIGGYDVFKEPTKVIANARYMLFTNQEYQSDIWEVIKVNDKRHPRTVARDIKINAHKWLPKHNVSVWVDHSFSPAFDRLPEPRFDVTCFAHHSRNCIYSEIAVCEQLGYITEAKVTELLEYCEKVNYPYSNGLSSSGFMVRGNTKDFNNKWWELVKMFSERDQLTQHLAAYLTGTSVGTFPQGLNVYSNPYLGSKTKHLPFT